MVLLRSPGTVEVTSYASAIGRRVKNWNDQLYAVVGQYLYSVDAGGLSVNLGSLIGSRRCTFGAGLDEMAICSSPNAYVLSSGGLSQITDADFLSPGGVAAVDGYAVFYEKDSNKLFCSDLNDFSSYDALYYATAEGAPGNINGIIADHRQILLTKASSCELWENVGGAGFPFARAINGFMEFGCVSGDTLTKADNTVYMLCSDLTVRRLEGLTWHRVSQHGVEQAIRTYDTSGVYGYTHTEDGHIFYCLTFPESDATWCFDVTTNEWHERESDGGHWRPVDAVQCYGKTYIQRLDTGAVGYLDPDVYTDCGDRMDVEWTYGAVYKSNKPLVHSMLEVVLETGNGIVGSTTAPQILLSQSNDGGREWHAMPMKSIGKIGERRTRVRWHALGQARDRIYRMRVTDPVKVVVTDTQIEVS